MQHDLQDALLIRMATASERARAVLQKSIDDWNEVFEEVPRHKTPRIVESTAMVLDVAPERERQWTP